MNKNLYVIFKTHLDIGYTDYAENVVNNYLDTFIPKALRLANKLNSENEKKFIWTTGTFLIYKYLKEMPNDKKRLMDLAIERGDISYHGLPFTTHSELMDEDMFLYGLSLKDELDKRYGIKTIASKMTDVPGHTKAIIPLLESSGIKFLHIGVNPASTAPNVPDLFQWRHKNSSVICMYHKGNYGSTMLFKDKPSIYFAHTNDNLGPQNEVEIYELYSYLKKNFQDKKIFAASLNSFADELIKFCDNIPVIENELGDTWIHGIASDPVKTSKYLALQRLNSKWNKGGVHYPFFDSLLLVPEHTWGVSAMAHLKDSQNYLKDDFNKVINSNNFVITQESWQEQREYINKAISVIGDKSHLSEAREVLNELIPMKPDLKGYEKVKPLDVIDINDYKVSFDYNGNIKELIFQNKNYKKVFTGLTYMQYCNKDYEKFLNQYLVTKPEWAIWDFSKIGMPETDRIIKKPDLKGIYVKDHDIIVYLSFGNAICFNEIYIQYKFNKDNLNLMISLFNKENNRMPESLWASFNPFIDNPQDVLFEKMNQLIKPTEVISHGARGLNAVQKLIHSEIQIEPLDSPLVDLGYKRLLNYNNKPFKYDSSFHFNLYNNVWNTNFRMWYNDDCIFRFNIKFIAKDGLK